ncbi:unnamed protein product [Prunus armeniaca]|uniref:Uncharacterized protein n=1 Tax=Prunus armeniaca TaxID=36596 RepID=A0A6J5XJQ9_PRUAR|nr:unnamed protein product [Prunus armeniaca]CAB4314060.1 unnamed protein product [Prunus armeniaca]
MPAKSSFLQANKTKSKTNNADYGISTYLPSHNSDAEYLKSLLEVCLRLLTDILSKCQVSSFGMDHRAHVVIVLHGAPRRSGPFCLQASLASSVGEFVRNVARRVSI